MNHKGEEKMKNFSSCTLRTFFVIAFAGCAAGVSQPSASTAPEASEAAPEASKASESASAETADGQFKVGFAIRTMDGAYYKTLADDVEKMAKGSRMGMRGPQCGRRYREKRPKICRHSFRWVST